jgi:hypothetical protein
LVRNPGLKSDIARGPKTFTKAEAITEHQRLRDKPLPVDGTGVDVIQAPKLGVGHSATPWQESTIGVGTVGIAMLVSSVLILWGLRRTADTTIEFSNICNSCVILNAGGSKV